MNADRELHVWLLLIRKSELIDCEIMSETNLGIFRWAASAGEIEIVKLLVQFEHVNLDNAIILAAKNGNDDIVKLLLADSRVDPAADDNAAIRWASFTQGS